ncbi:unnamed protein product [Staphylococcus haemolyticus JCSC1435]|uniref:Uncharacterized protein n=1 Tax=Staphylococcus haemolyticus (strain JCSC1435) TaxID=279808 RepID=Q4L9Z6_STAHJ|nr:unnamed protein product [Staphylococcus haemolyticus JCSC1435]
MNSLSFSHFLYLEVEILKSEFINGKYYNKTY